MARKKYLFESCSIMLSEGHITEFKELLKYIPRTALSKKMEIGYRKSLKVFGNDIGSLALKDIQKVAEALKVDFDVVNQIVIRQFKREINKKK